MIFYTKISDRPRWPHSTIVKIADAGGQILSCSWPACPPKGAKGWTTEFWMSVKIEEAIKNFPEPERCRVYFRYIGYRSRAEIAADEDCNRTMVLATCFKRLAAFHDV